MQIAGRNVKKIAIFFTLFSVITYLSAALFIFFLPSKYSNCQRYSEELNGGVKEFKGEKYYIKMCGTGGNENSNSDKIELEIFNEQGELLAKRHFMVDWMANSHLPLEYHQDYLIYYDFSTHSDIIKKINMPPTTIDWIRARLPFFN